MATELGKAYVQIVPSAQGISGKIVSAIEPEAQKAGAAGGAALNKGFTSGISAFAVAAGQLLAGFARDAWSKLRGVVDVGAAFDAAMSQVAAVSGAAGEDFDALREKAMEMGASTKFSASESAEALNYMAMAGWKTEQMLGGLEGIMNLAAASGESLATTSDIVTDALTAFNMTAEESGRFADILAAASSNANTNVGMMGETFKYVAPVAGGLGYSVEDVATAIGLMANAGIKGTMAGTALRGMMTRLAKPTKESETAMQALSVSLEDSEGNMYSFLEVLEQIREGFSGMEGAERAEYAAMLAGQEGMSGLLAIINASDADFENLVESIYGAEGAAKRMADTMQDNLAGDITIMKSALEGASIVLADRLTPTLREFTQFASDGISQVADAFQSGGLNEAMGTFGTVLAQGLNMVIQRLPEAVTAGMQFLGALAEGLLQNLPTLNEAFLTLVTEGLARFYLGIPKAISAGAELLQSLAEGISERLPELAAVAGGVVIALAEHLVDATPTVIGAAWTVLETIGAVLLEQGPRLLEAGLRLIEKIGTGLLAGIPTLLEKLPEISNGIVGFLTEQLPQLLQLGVAITLELVRGLVEALPEILEAGVQLILTLVDALVQPEMIGMLIDAVFSMDTALANGLLEALPMIVEAAVQLVGALAEALVQSEMIQKLVAGAATMVTTLAGGLLEALPEILEAGMQLILTLVDALLQPEMIASLVETMLELVLRMAEGLVDALPLILDAGVQMVLTLVEAMLDPAVLWTLLDAAVKLIGELAYGLLEAIPQIAAAAVEIIAGLADALTEDGTLLLLIGAALELMQQLGIGLIRAIPEIVEAAWQIIVDLWQCLTNPASMDKFMEAGRQMLEGLWEGVKSYVEILKEKVTGVVDTIKGWFTGKSGFDEHSPSRWAEDVFSKVLEGGEKGLEKAAPGLLETVGGVLDGVQDAFSGGINLYAVGETIRGTATETPGVPIPEQTRSIRDAAGGKQLRAAMNAPALAGDEFGRAAADIANGVAAAMQGDGGEREVHITIQLGGTEIERVIYRLASNGAQIQGSSLVKVGG